MSDPSLQDFDAGQQLVEWRRLVEKGLKGQDFATLQATTGDGIAINPLYPARIDTAPLVGRGARAWTIMQPVDDPDPEGANRQALDDLDGGATGLSLRFKGSPGAAGHGLAADAASMGAALAGIDLGAVHIRIDPHPAALETARLLKTMIAESGIAAERASASFGLDPIGPAAFAGRDVPPALNFAGCFRELMATGLRGPIAELDGRVFHEAGGTEAQELAAILASALWWMHALDDEAALSFFGATLTVDRDQFLSTAKLRALRLLWARLIELCGAAGMALCIHAETSRRMMTRADPRGNLLRTTIAAFAAAVGGADSLLVLPHTAALGLPSSEARSLARNVQHLLMQEAHLHRVADPSAGSGAFEALTDALADCAWTEFQAIEREGGIAESLRSGAFPSRIEKARAALAGNLRAGHMPLVGATAYRPADAPGAPAAIASPQAKRPDLVPVRLEDIAAA